MVSGIPERTPGKILIVEDSPVQAETLKQLLESRGYSVEVSENGWDALNALPR